VLYGMSVSAVGGGKILLPTAAPSTWFKKKRKNLFLRFWQNH